MSRLLKHEEPDSNRQRRERTWNRFGGISDTGVAEPLFFFFFFKGSLGSWWRLFAQVPTYVKSWEPRAEKGKEKEKEPGPGPPCGDRSWHLLLVRDSQNGEEISQRPHPGLRPRPRVTTVAELTLGTSSVRLLGATGYAFV